MHEQLRSEVLREVAAFDALGAAWADLVRRSPGATPFQHAAWLSAWARAYAPEGALRVVLVRQDDRLVAAAPMVLVRRGPWRVLTPLGGDQTDFLDVLVDPAVPGAGAALTTALLGEPGWQVLDLPELRPDAAALRWVADWPGRVTRSASSVSLELPALPVEDLLARLPGRTASTLRRKLRKVDAAQVQSAAVPAAGVAVAVGELLALHERQWAGRDGNPEHLTGRFAALLTGALPRMVADGAAELVRYTADDEVVAAQIEMVGGGMYGYYLAGVSPSLRERIDVASLLIRHDVDAAVATGATCYSMLRGLEDYKLRWRPVEVVHARLLLTRPGVGTGPGYAVVVRGRAVVVAWAKQQRWVDRVHERIAVLRRR